jgi:gliding motility-associated-like protein
VASEYNCWDTITKPVTVFVQPRASFYVNPVLLKFPENVVSITNNTNFGPFDYFWEFGDIDATTSTLEEPGGFEYEHWGEKIIELSVVSQTNPNCLDYYADTILIMPPEVNADFTTNIDGGCLNDGLEVIFTAAQSAYDEQYLYEWDFGDGNTATGQITSHTYEEAGVYNVQLTAKSQEIGISEDYEYKTIRVYDNPVANFEVIPNVAMIDAQTRTARIEFFNQSTCNDTSGCSYMWYFGDGETSIAGNVTHNYAKPPDDEIPKEFDVMLKVTNSQGCVDSLIKEKEVTIIGEGDIRFPNAFTPYNNDGLNDIFRPVSKGVIEYELLIYNRWGELIYQTKDLNAGWDGRVGGEPAKPDVYVWKAIGKFTNGRAFEIAGDVTLIR